STPFDNDQFTSLTNNSEDSVIEPHRLFINRENQLTSSTLIENSISDKLVYQILELSKKDFDYMINPQQILFTQAQINLYFLGNDRFTVENTINDLVTDKLKPQDLAIICLERLMKGLVLVGKEKKSLKIIKNKIWNNVVVLYLARPNKIYQKNGEVW
ncbi:17102_t:CDS:2, partial [Gigaspora rosea]